MITEKIQQKAPYFAAPGIGIPQNYDVVKYIIDQTARFYKIESEMLKTQTRKIEIRWPRQVAAYLIQKHTKLSLQNTAGHLGYKNHATVYHAKKVVKNLMEVERGVRNEVTTLDGYITNSANNMLQFVLKQVSDEFNVQPKDLINPCSPDEPFYTALCTAIWLMQAEFKSSNERLGVYFNAGTYFIDKALAHRVNLAVKNPEFFTQTVQLRKKINNHFKINTASNENSI